MHATKKAWRIFKDNHLFLLIKFVTNADLEHDVATCKKIQLLIVSVNELVENIKWHDATHVSEIDLFGVSAQEIHGAADKIFPGDGVGA